MGPGAAFADETAPATAETSTPAPAPVEEPPAAPAEEPAGEAPAPAPVEEEPAQEAPAPSTPVETPAEPEAPAEEPAAEVAETPAAPAADAPVEATLADAILSKAFAALEVAEAAVTVPCVGGPATVVGGFEIDGNICAQTNLDWDTTGLYTEDGLDDSTAFEGGDSEGDDPADWGGGGPTPNGKTDIGDFWAFSQISGGDVYGFFGITNASDTGGTSQYDVEYNQQSNIAQDGITVPDRTPGDLLFRFSSTGSDPILFTDAKRWTALDDAEWDDTDCEEITADAGWCTIPIPGGVFAQQTNAAGTFFEGAINISLLIGEGNCTGNFGVVQVRSVTGNAFYTSALKDYVTPLGVNTPSTCGSIIIEKEDTEGNPLGGATFSVSPNPDPEADDLTPYSITDNDENDKNPADGIIEINPVDPNDEYTVTETDAPDGYLLPIPASQGPAFVGEAGSVRFTFEDPKQWEALTAEKTAEVSYTAEYDWSILKEISATGDAPWSSSTAADSPLVSTIAADGDPTLAPFFYRVTVTEGARETRDYVVSGDISVTNPNDEAVEADISDSLPGADCLVEGEETLTVDVPADGTTDYAYVCTFDGTPEDLEGTNTATVSWDISTYPQEEGDQVVDGDYTLSPEADYAFGEETTSINKTITVTDDNHVFDPAWVIEWSAEGDENVSDVYEIELSAPAGECSEILANTASVIGDEDAVLDSDTAYAQLCTVVLWEPLSASKSAEETYTASYDWSILKEVSATGDEPWSALTDDGAPLVTTIPADGDPTLLPFFYRVTVTEGARTTSDYAVSGAISVTNPNDGPVTADISDSLPGADCLVEGEATHTVDVPADATTDYAYVCTFDGTPADLEGTNTATVSWDTSDYPQVLGDQNVEGDYTLSPEADYAFGEETTAINKTVTVTDDNHVFDPAWVIEWSAEGDQNVSDVYEIELSAPAGECSEVLVNTATITGDEEEVLGTDSAYAQLCTTLPTLTLAKVVFNIDGDAVPADFDLTATPVEIEGQEPVTGNGDPTDEGGVASVPVKAGDYDLSESGLEGYSQVGDWDCGDAVVVDGDTVTVGYGTDITCTVTNGEDVVAPPVPPTVVEPPAALPETGGPNQGLLLGGLAMLLAGLGLTLLGRRKSQG